jgi:hypothetical protein
MTPTVGSKGSEASIVAAEMGISVKSATETGTGANNQNQNNNSTANDKPAGNGQGSAEQQQVVQPKVITIGKKQEQAPEQQVVQKKPTEEAPAENAEDFERQFETRLSERFGHDSKKLSEVLGRLPVLEEQLTADPYKSPFTKQLDDLLGKGIPVETAVKYLTTDSSKLSHKELMAFKMQQEYPEMALEKIIRQIDRKYKLGDFAPTKKVDGEDVADESDGLEQLEFDAQPIKKEFDALKGQMLENGKSRADVVNQQKEVERVKAWAPAAQKIVESFDTIQTEMPNGNLLKFAVEMSPEEKVAYQGQIAQLIKNNPNLAADEAGLKTAKAVIETLYVAKNWTKMAIAFAEQGRSMSDEEWIAEIHNPSLKNTAARQYSGAKPKLDRDDSIVNHIEKAEGRGRTRTK